MPHIIDLADTAANARESERELTTVLRYEPDDKLINCVADYCPPCDKEKSDGNKRNEEG